MANIDLAKVLREHAEWLESDAKEGKRADLSSAKMPAGTVHP